MGFCRHLPPTNPCNFEKKIKKEKEMYQMLKLFLKTILLF
jgi:hypothetical protein